MGRSQLLIIVRTQMDSARGMHARLPTGRKKQMGSEPANWIYGCNESGVTENGMSYQSELMLPLASHASLQLPATVPPVESGQQHHQSVQNLSLLGICSGAAPSAE